MSPKVCPQEDFPSVKTKEDGLALLLSTGAWCALVMVALAGFSCPTSICHHVLSLIREKCLKPVHVIGGTVGSTVALQIESPLYNAREGAQESRMRGISVPRQT